MYYSFTPLFRDKSPEHIASTLLDIAKTNLEKKYGPDPDLLISYCLEEEWEDMHSTNSLMDVAALYELSLWLKEHGIPYRMFNSAGSGFLLYLLGITFANPLSPHYYCPKCRRVLWENVSDGFDLPMNRHCEHDGTLMLPDGHGLLSAILWQCGGDTPLFTMDLPRSLYIPFRDFLSQHWLANPNSPKCSVKEDLFGSAYFLSNLHFTFRIEASTVQPSFHETVVDASCLQAIMDSAQNLLCAPLPSNIDIANFTDLVSWKGLQLSSTWTKEKEYLHRNLGYRLEELLPFQDNLLHYLFRHYTGYEEACEGVNHFCRGKGFPEITEEMEHSPDKWILSCCKNVRYLYPKSHVIEEIYFNYKATVLPENTQTIPTGFITVDGFLHGIAPRDLVLLGGRPAMGHTEFALDILAHLALHENKKVMILTANERDGKLYQEAIAARQQLVAPKNLTVCHTLPLTTSAVSDCLKKEPVDLLFIDNLKAFPKRPRWTLSEHMRRTARELKEIAKEYHVPIFLLTYLYRQMELRYPPYPTAKHIPYGQEILPFMDTVLLLYRDGYYVATENQNLAWVFIEKNTRGKTGAVTLKWDDKNRRFENPTR